MFIVNELYNSPTGQVFRCTAWDWNDRSWWFHPLNGEPSYGSGFWVSEDGRELGEGPSSPVLILLKNEDDMKASNSKQQKFIKGDQDLFNEILDEIPFEATVQQIEEKDLTNLEWKSLEDFIKKLKTTVPSDAYKISLFSDEGRYGISWVRTKKVQYTKSKREIMAYKKMQIEIHERIQKERMQKLQQKAEENERAQYERLKKKFERQ